MPQHTEPPRPRDDPRELLELAESLSGLQRQSASTAQYLQDRLRVGARLLKALQLQIDHVQGLRAATQGTAEAAQRNVADLAEMRGIIERQARELLDSGLARIEERLAAARERAERIEAMVESAEVNIAVLLHKAAKAAQGVELKPDRGRRGPRDRARPTASAT